LVRLFTVSWGDGVIFSSTEYDRFKSRNYLTGLFYFEFGISGLLFFKLPGG
jgi:hypothetical protein